MTGCGKQYDVLDKIADSTTVGESISDKVQDELDVESSNAEYIIKRLAAAVNKTDADSTSEDEGTETGERPEYDPLKYVDVSGCNIAETAKTQDVDISEKDIDNAVKEEMMNQNIFSKKEKSESGDIVVIQLMAGVIPSLAKLQKKGEHGQKVTKFITNIVGIVLAAIQSLCMAIGFNKSGMITRNAVFSAIAITVFMTAGTGIMMYLAHIITEKAIGNGVSVLLMANIVSRMPGQFASMAKSVVDGKSKMVAALSITGFIALLLLMIIVIIYMTEGYHPLHVQYSQKMSQSGEDAETGQIPVKVGISGVMPIIFASSLMAIPQLIATIAGKGYGSGYSKIFLNMMTQKNWFDNDHPIYAVGLLIYLALIVFFAFFYLPVTFNAAEISDNIRKAGGFIPGVRAGEDTENYIQSISRRLTSIGVVMLICVTVIPMAICGSLGITTTISGTSLIIVIGVVAETMQQIQLEMAGRNYCGILCQDTEK